MGVEAYKPQDGPPLPSRVLASRAPPPPDPADRILIAGARNQGARLVTCDGSLLDNATSGHVQVLSGRR